MTARLMCRPLDRRDVPAVFTVTNLADAGAGSLRQAVLDANAAPGADSIHFAPDVAGKITLTSGSLAITGELTITGPGKAVVTVSGNFASRVLDVNTAKAEIIGLKIADGKAVLASGGGILIAGGSTVTLRECDVTGNTCEFSGGGISNGGTLTLERTRVGNNSVEPFSGPGTRQGGGVYSSGPIVVRESLIESNGITFGGTGGGLYLSGSAVFESSAVISNGTSGSGSSGGGIAFFGGSLTVRNTTIAKNVAQSSSSTAGGLLVSASSLIIHNSTIINNAVSAQGGGLAIFSVTTCEVVSSIIYNNSAFPFGYGPDVFAFGSPSMTVQYSAIGVAPLGANVVNPVGNLPYGMDLKINAVAANGGWTPTASLQAGSPCRNAGANPANLTSDQRGPGFVRASEGQPDMGAYEYQVEPPPTVSQLQVNDGSPQRSRVTSLTVTFSTPVLVTNPVSAAFELKRISDGAAVQLQAVADATSQIVTLTFVGGAVDGTSLADGSYTLTAFATKISTSGGSLDGNADGKSGDDYVSGAVVRRFGDGDGDGVVNFTDFLMFRSSFGQPNFDAAFDADGNGAVDFLDFLAFRARFAA